MSAPWTDRVTDAMRAPPRVLYHAIGERRLHQRYETTGTILPPIRGWTTEEAARIFARRTHRTVILHLDVDGDAWPMPDHHVAEGLAFWCLAILGWMRLEDEK